MAFWSRWFSRVDLMLWTQKGQREGERDRGRRPEGVCVGGVPREKPWSNS